MPDADVSRLGASARARFVPFVLACWTACVPAGCRDGAAERELPRETVADADFDFTHVGDRPGHIVVMTRNVCVGAALEDILEVASPARIPEVAAAAWAAVLASRFAERAEAFAHEVDRYRPHFIGLQEITTYYRQTPSDFDLRAFDAGRPASEPVLDFLEVLSEALRERGLRYRVATLAPHFTAEVPMVDSTACGVHADCLSDMRVQDYDAILARSDVVIDEASSVAANFPPDLTFEKAPIGLPLPRGWASVDATVAGIGFRFAVTHLEPADPDGIVDPTLETLQRGQAAHLRERLLEEGKPLILVGDLNTDAYGRSTLTYSYFIDAGWTDTWTGQRRAYTCCQAEDLENRSSILHRRVDLVLVYGAFESGGLPMEIGARVFGDRPEDRTPSGLWPSDHAGVVAALGPAPARDR